MENMKSAPDMHQTDAPGQKLRRTEDKSVRQLQLIEATIDRIAEFGIVGTTLAKVTETAGLSHGLVSFHFATKERLFEETLRFVANVHRNLRHRKIRKAKENDVDRLLTIAESLFHPRIFSRKKLSVRLACFGETANRSIATDIDEERHQESKRLIRKMTDSGDYIGIDPTLVSLTLEALVDGRWLNMLVYPIDFSRELSKMQMRRVLALMFPRHFGPLIPLADGKP